MGTKRTLTLALLLAAGAVLVGGTASAVDSQNPSGHFLGALAAQGAHAQGADSSWSPSPNLTWHGGPVMHSNTVYSIYWAPAGYSYQSGYSAAIDSYFRNVATDSGKKTNVYAVDVQYSSIQYNSSSGGAHTNTTALATGGAPDLRRWHHRVLTAAQIQDEVDNTIAQKRLTRDCTSVFFVFTTTGSSRSYHGVSNFGAINASPSQAAREVFDESQDRNGSSNQADPTITVVTRAVRTQDQIVLPVHRS